MLRTVFLTPLALLTACFLAFSMLVAVTPVLADHPDEDEESEMHDEHEDSDHDEEDENEHEDEENDEDEDEEDTIPEEGLYISVEEHGGRTHIHIYEDGKQTDSFFLEQYELDETDLIIEAIAEEIDESVADVEAAAHFASVDEEDEDEHEHEDEHEDEDEEEDHTHGLENAADKISDKMTGDKEEQMQALLKVLQQLIALLTKQLEMKADVMEHVDDMKDKHEDHEHSDHDEHDMDDEDEDEEDPYAGIHIMADGTVMLGDGTEVTDATITEDGMIVLEDGTELEPAFDLR